MTFETDSEVTEMNAEITSDRNALEIECKQLAADWNTVFESFYKLAPMSFALNGLLLASVPFLTSQWDATTRPFAIFVWAAIGVIYNLGALSFYLANLIQARKLAKRQEDIEALLKMEIHKFTFWYTFFLRVTGLLTIWFFVLLICVWIIFYFVF